MEKVPDITTHLTSMRNLYFQLEISEIVYQLCIINIGNSYQMCIPLLTITMAILKHQLHDSVLSAARGLELYESSDKERKLDEKSREN